MKVGDKVRFLNAIGGGVISRIDKGGIVIVTDDDGFDVPTLATEIVVVGETTHLNIPKRTPHHEYALEDTAEDSLEEDYEIDPADLPITFKPKPIEREGGDTLSLYLAFVPMRGSQALQSDIEVYLVNDSNYYVSFAYMQREMGAYLLLKQEVLDPNTKLSLGQVERNNLAVIEHLHIQGFAYKTDTDFSVQPIINTAVKLNLKKFYKSSSFTDSVFFDTPALLYPLLDNSSATEITEDTLLALQEGVEGMTGDVAPPIRKVPTAKQQSDGTLVVDLHATALLDSMNGLSPADILNYQVEHFKLVMEQNKSEVNKKIVFIHGKGEGVLRKAIITELRRKYKRCHYQDASFAEYGFGATQVTIQR